MTLTQGILLGVGALLEFVGIVVLAAPDLVPYRDRLARWLAPKARAVVNALRRLVGLPPKRKVVEVSASVSAGAPVRASGIVGIGPNTTLEDKVEWLLRRNQQEQERANQLAARLRDLEDDLPRHIAALSDGLRRHVADEITAAQADYRQLRVIGAGVLVAGLFCTTLANFV